MWCERYTARIGWGVTLDETEMNVDVPETTTDQPSGSASSLHPGMADDTGRGGDQTKKCKYDDKGMCEKHGGMGEKM